MIKLGLNAGKRIMRYSDRIDITTRPSDGFVWTKNAVLFAVSKSDPKAVFMCNTAADIRKIFDDNLSISEWRTVQGNIENFVTMFSPVESPINTRVINLLTTEEYVPDNFWIVKDSANKFLGDAGGELLLAFIDETRARTFIKANGWNDATPIVINMVELIALAIKHKRIVSLNTPPNHPMILSFFG